MADSIIVYNQPEQKMFNVDVDKDWTKVDLSEIGLESAVDLSKLVSDETFALKFDGSSWESMDYMKWEDLRINEALEDVKGEFSQSTQDSLARFVAGMDIKYQGKKSWVELLTELGKEFDK
ncbi:hypothetical protein [Lentilactobacillus sp. Marseille-Q4993]|uniref:hypothetical protein n=1 Tax=Lentilactobacillus sp. Marseille-Q4993 TaxID=3039492 RepID=UPI0024BCF7B7|nr:hypothetical protein [Lentilactobacillus sp. Marseille-Q4993]